MKHPINKLCLAILIVGLSACQTNPAVDNADALFESGQWRMGLEKLRVAVQANPSDAQLRAHFARRRDTSLSVQIARAESLRQIGQFPQAENTIAEVLSFDPGNARAITVSESVRRDAALQLKIRNIEAGLETAKPEQLRDAVALLIKEYPSNTQLRTLYRRVDEMASPTAWGAQSLELETRFAKKVSLDFQDSSLRAIVEVLGRTAGINFVFDSDVKRDLKATIQTRETKVEDALKLLLRSNQLAQHVVNDSTVMIYPNSPAKNREYQQLAVRSFYLTNADGKNTQRLIADFVKPKNLYYDEKLNLLIMRDTPDGIALAERLIKLQDLAEPELLLEVEVVEVATDKIQDIGIKWPDQVSFSVVGGASGVANATPVPGQLAWNEWRNRSSGLVRMSINDPSLILNLKQSDSSTNVLANPRIRVKNREKAKIHIGDRVPVVTTTSSGSNNAVSQNVNYLDVGLQLDVEPSVQLSDDVSIKVNLEVSSIVSEVRTGSNQDVLAYRIGRRSVATTLRLRDGETEVLAGLIQDEDRRSGARVPGLGEFPVLGKLFGTDRSNRLKTEIVLLITPRIVRPLITPRMADQLFPAGTESQTSGTNSGGASSFLGAGGVGGAGRTSLPPGAPAIPSPTPNTAPRPSSSVTLPTGGVQSGVTTVPTTPFFTPTNNDAGSGN